MKAEQIGKGFSMKQPRTKYAATLAAIFFIGGTLASLSGDFYAEKWGSFVAIVGVAIALALVIEYEWERHMSRAA